MPPTSEVGPVHEVHRSPGPWAGTRPEATAPAMVPNRNGVTTEDVANITPWNRARASVGDILRNANAAPRITIPAPARQNGTNSVSMIEANASGKPVQRYTSTKTSHTWLASHTGPIARSMSERIGAPRSASPAVRSHTPLPKSAPANRA